MNDFDLDTVMCEACIRGDHGNCGLQSWCDCLDDRDGDEYATPDPSGQEDAP